MANRYGMMPGVVDKRQPDANGGQSSCLNTSAKVDWNAGNRARGWYMGRRASLQRVTDSEPGTLGLLRAVTMPPD
jgi:hypothetical protein